MKRYTQRQQGGTEYGGTDTVHGGMQPTVKALTNAEMLRLDYLTGKRDVRSLDDRRQMMGLLPGNGRPPRWLLNVDDLATPSDYEVATSGSTTVYLPGQTIQINTQNFEGHGAPGIIAGSHVGDQYLDLDTGNVYTLD